MHCELPLVIPKTFSHRNSSRKLKMEDLRPCDSCPVETLTENSRMAVPLPLQVDLVGHFPILSMRVVR